MKRLLAGLCLLLVCLSGSAQIVNLLKAGRETYLRYASCRMQPFSENNLPVAAEMYSQALASGDFKARAYALHIEFPVRHYMGDQERMDQCVEEIRQLVSEKKEFRSFWLGIQNEWCQYLINEGRVGEAMLEAREMQRLAGKEKNALGNLYSHKIVGLIQTERTNYHLAADNFQRAVNACKDARADNELPNLYILLAQTYTKLGEYGNAEYYCSLAEKYQEFSDNIRLKALMTRAILCCTRGNMRGFYEYYDIIQAFPSYKNRIDDDERLGLDVEYLRTHGMFSEALVKADSLSNGRIRHQFKQDLYARAGNYPMAYSELGLLMDNKDSIYIKVQNEDLAILDAEMNNAQLREEAQKLKAQNQLTILGGFLVMFAIAFFAILLSQWQLRHNLEEMRKKNSEMLRSRRAFQSAMEAKEAEVTSKLTLLQNRTTNVLTGYEDFLNI